MRITLTVTEGPHKGLEFAFARHDTFLVGRSRHAHFQLPAKDKFFSRIHFLIEVNPPQCRLVDLGSHNGTYVNGSRVLSADLNDGDQIRAGHTILKLMVHSPTPENAPMEAGRGHFDRPRVNLHAATPGHVLQRELGRGPLGTVYLASREADGSQVCVKVVVPKMAGSAKQIETFLHEARALTALKHAHIAALRDLGESGALLYFVSDYVPGVDAGRVLKEHGPLALPRVLALADQALQALEFAHAMGIVHRDIKPSNLMLWEAGGQESLALTDCGVARVYDASQLSGVTMTTDLEGAVAFMPPEQLTNYREVLPSADQYALAATLYTLLTGQHIFDFPAETPRQFSVILRQTPVPIQTRRPDVPDGVAAALHKALARNPANRFENVAAFRKALSSAILA